MERTIHHIQNLVMSTQEFEKMKDLIPRCRKILDENECKTIEDMERLIKEDWQELYDAFPYLGYREPKAIVFDSFSDLKNGIIDKSTFELVVERAFIYIMQYYKVLKEGKTEAENQFWQDYDSFFSENALLMQPEVKTAFNSFLVNYTC